MHRNDNLITPEQRSRLQPYITRRFPLEEVRVTQADDGTKRLEWYASVFESLSEDLGGFRERIGRRAFTKTLQEGDARAFSIMTRTTFLVATKLGPSISGPI